MSRLAICTISLLLLASLCAAQRMPVGMTGRFMLVMMPDAKKELKITKEQDKQIQQVMKEANDAARSGQMPAGFDFMNPMGHLDPKLASILTPEQAARLEELFVQANGGFSLLDSKVSTALGLSDEVNGQIKELNSEAAAEQMRTLQGGMRSKADADKLKKVRADYGAKMLALLSPEQAKKFETMKGKPFKFKD
jgi:Spy/CpxP family protein refolding chaperone